jgi:hypothetical protein
MRATLWVLESTQRLRSARIGSTDPNVTPAATVTVSSPMALSESRYELEVT